MTRLRKWIALLLLAVFLPATAMAQTCAARCAYEGKSVSAMQQQSAPMASDHCAKKNAKPCSLAAVCDFANLFVLTTPSFEFAASPITHPPIFFPADFISVVHPPALRPPIHTA
jgi:hypothetical protein